MGPENVYPLTVEYDHQDEFYKGQSTDDPVHPLLGVLVKSAFGVDRESEV